jgi:flavin reductase (DIM6/NTAB) family NADH-FMN oxidoreductase RutF
MQWLKTILRKVFKRVNFVAVGLTEDSPEARLFLSLGKEKMDVSGRHSLVALKPVTIAIGGLQADVTDHATLEILYGKKIYGILKLRRSGHISSGGKEISLFTVTGQRNFLFDFMQRQADRLYLYIQNAINRKPYNFFMQVKELNKLHTYYMVPKPVVLITVFDGEKYDLFPMDITGFVAEDCFLLGLRNTSPAVAKMIGSGKICISTVPLDKKEEAYKLGAHHKNAEIDLPAISFALTDSKLYGWKVPAFALEVMEAVIMQHEQQGSHTLFVSRVENRYQMNQGPRLAHTPWFFKTCFEQATF